MSKITDPARELAEIAERLTHGSNKTGESFLAEEFETEVWSTSFVKIIACIMERADLVSAIVSKSPMDEDHRENALTDLRSFKAGFTGASLRTAWHNTDGGAAFMKAHGRPLQYLSPTVRAKVAYPKLSDEEVAEFIGLIDAYLEQLQTSDEGPDFVRQAITDGLTSFRFQLEYIGWMGAGYALSAFREVMFIAEASSRDLQGRANIDAAAYLRDLVALVKKFKEKVDSAKGWSDTTEAVWKWYQIGSSVATPLLLAGNLHGSN